MTFGYNVNLWSDTTKRRIAEFSENLLAELSGERFHPAEKLRPILFICHSMGGIVVKRALTVAQGRGYYNSIHEATQSVAFMATPHRGSDKVALGAIGQRLGSILFWQDATAAAMKKLDMFSAVLEDYNTDFENIANDYKFIVEKWSAIMGHANERSRLAMAANHRNICKFKNEDSDNFQTLFKQLRVLVQEALESQEKSASKLDGLASSHAIQGSASSISYDPSQMRSRKRSLSPVREDQGTSTNSSNKRPRARDSLPSKDSRHDITTVTCGVPHFIGGGYFSRDNTLSQVYEGLTNEELPWSFGIYGLGGVGKTQLALKYISTYQHMYTHFTLRLGLIENGDEDSTKYRDAFKDWLLHRKSWLLVFDNVEDPTVPKEYLPSTCTGAVLTTSL
ncbi:hypothetical protein DL98DRAFT_586194 [Cadophora sp. DSE1049]|nr:hypothetical protein DL98DRAFT_586194 [Cadophora sp. DSE1049]